MNVNNPYRPPKIPSDPPERPADPSSGFGWSGNMRVYASMAAVVIGLGGLVGFVIVRLLGWLAG